MQNDDGTSGEKWHKSDTRGSPSVRADLAEAAKWYTDHRAECVGRVVPALRERFGLSPKQAIDALRIANGVA